MLVWLVSLGNSAWAENDGRDTALINQMAHVACEGSRTDPVLAPMRLKDAGHLYCGRDLWALVRAIVVVEKFTVRRAILEKTVAGVYIIDGTPEGVHDIRNVAHAGRKIGTSSQNRLSCRDGLIEAPGYLSNDKGERC